MRIQKITVDNQIKQDKPVQSQVAPSFKAGNGYTAALNASGGLMQWIEDGGFLVSFLIQDSLGMTLPRGVAGFLRDKEVTGQYNVQEGFEVLGREGLTGPTMMAVAPIMMAIAAKFGRSTSVNSQLIKRFGNSLKEIVSNPNFDKSLLADKNKFKEVFYKNNITKMLQDTLGKENVTDDLVSNIMKELKNYEQIPSDAQIKGAMGKSKYKKERIANISKYINDIKYSTSSDLEMLDTLKVGSGKDNKAFSTKNSLDAMIKYADDAITLNKNLSKMDEAAAEDLKNQSIAKRVITNISTMAATLGVLAVLPKLYIRNSISPGARTAMKMKEMPSETQNEGNLNDNTNISENSNNGQVSFKGKGGKSSALGKVGKFISDHTNEKLSSELEYNGHNFTNTLMAGLSLFGLLLPRGMRAYNRAQVDDNGKRDLTEIYEILIRDVTSSLAVVFAVPMLTRACVSSYENSSGFVLMNKNRNMSKTKKILDLLNPYSGSHVLTNAEIASLYNNVDSKEKMVNFCKYIDKNNGDLEKILSKSENYEELTKEISKDLSKLSKSDKNKEITSFFEKLASNKEINEKVTKLMKGVGDKKGNKIASFARGLNSIPATIATFVISPVLLGWFIPRLTYANTRRLHANEEKEKNKKINASA